MLIRSPSGSQEYIDDLTLEQEKTESIWKKDASASSGWGWRKAMVAQQAWHRNTSKAKGRGNVVTSFATTYVEKGSRVWDDIEVETGGKGERKG